MNSHGIEFLKNASKFRKKNLYSRQEILRPSRAVMAKKKSITKCGAREVLIFIYLLLATTVIAAYDTFSL